jgi:hypothetical protein
MVPQFQDLFSRVELSSAEYLMRLIAVVIVGVVFISLYRSHHKEFKGVGHGLPWFVRGTALAVIVWVVFALLFSAVWTVASLTVPNSVVVNLLFGGALVAFFCWVVQLFGTDGAPKRRMEMSRYYMLASALLLLGASALMWTSFYPGAIVTVILALFLLWLCYVLFAGRRRHSSSSSASASASVDSDADTVSGASSSSD